MALRVAGAEAGALTAGRQHGGNLALGEELESIKVKPTETTKAIE